MIQKKQIDNYHTNGFLVVEDLIPKDTLQKLQNTTQEFVSKSASKKHNDDIYDLSDDHSEKNPKLRRLKNPHLIHEVYKNITTDDCILNVVESLVGKNIRRDHTKLNFKAAKGGESIEWHQDWAFYPHTNDNIVEVGIFLDDCYDDNGPLMAVPGSHRGPIDDHHYKGKFIGAVDPSVSNYDISSAIPFLASAGSVSFHHVRSLHGSKKNNSNKSRRVLFIGYAAADAWPLTGFRDLPLSPSTSQEDFKKVYTNNIVRGGPCLEARVEINPIKMPYPPSNSLGSIYENQKEVRGRSFGE